MNPLPRLHALPRLLTQRDGRMTRALLLLLPLLLALTWLAFAWAQEGAQELGETRLDGPRGPQCLRLLMASDVSGSMAGYAEPRDRAVEQFQRWAPSNLRPNDEIAVLEFADYASWIHAPAGTGPHAGISRPAGTSLQAVLSLARTAPATPCRTWLVLISDGDFGDYPTNQQIALDKLTDAGVDDITLLIPDPELPLPHQWGHLYPYSDTAHFNGNNANETALTIGQHTARILNQTLQHNQ